MGWAGCAAGMITWEDCRYDMEGLMHHSIKLLDIHVSLGGVPILQGATIEAAPCELVAIVGPNGTGKTTLLKVANGTIKPDCGRVVLFGEDLAGRRNTDNVRRKIAVVPQKSTYRQFPLRVEEAVLMGRYGKIGIMRRPQEEDRAVATEAMRITGILPFARKLVSELSGGERQKVSLSRALAQEPEILLLDEPTTYLDEASSEEIMEKIHELHHERQFTTLMVSHRPDWVRMYADKVYSLKEGRSCVLT
jgi:iron complex transport system ATP-binding protein